MTPSLKIQITALAAMVAIGVAAPLAAWMIRPDPTARVSARSVLAQPIALGIQEVPAPAAILAITVPEVTLEPVIAVMPEAPKRAMRCSWHQGQTFAEGQVLVCDDRTRSVSVAPTGLLLAPSKKPTRLAPRDTPSPTGLLR